MLKVSNDRSIHKGIETVGLWIIIIEIAAQMRQMMIRMGMMMMMIMMMMVLNGMLMMMVIIIIIMIIIIIIIHNTIEKLIGMLVYAWWARIGTVDYESPGAGRAGLDFG